MKIQFGISVDIHKFIMFWSCGRTNIKIYWNGVVESQGFVDNRLLYA